MRAIIPNNVPGILIVYVTNDKIYRKIPVVAWCVDISNDGNDSVCVTPLPANPILCKEWFLEYPKNCKPVRWANPAHHLNTDDDRYGQDYDNILEAVDDCDRAQKKEMGLPLDY